LATIDTTGVAATRHPIHLETPFREDIVGPHLSNADALDNAPERDGPSFVVPRVV
jgi:aspartyl/glutamyl-tRNA(Asn/Gln) amidotransferase C subunit